MAEAQSQRMESLPRHAEAGASSVRRIGHQRMAARRQMNPNLVRAPSVEAAFQQRIAAFADEATDIGASRPARPDDRHANA